MVKKGFIIFCIIGLVSLVAVGQGKKKGKSSLRDRTENADYKAESAFIEAQKQLILENYTKAYELFLVAAELSPNNAAVNFKLAEVLLKNGEKDKAAFHAQRARELDPENKYYYVLNAEILQSQGDLDGAAKVYEELTSRITGTEQYLFDLAVIYQYQNKLDDALSVYQRAENHYGRTEALLLEKQKILLKQGNLDALVSEWDQLIAENPDEPRYTVKLVEILISNERFEEAEKRLATLRDKRQSVQADLLYSEIERKKGNLTRALDLLKSPLRSNEIDIDEKLKLLGSYIRYLPNEEVKESILEASDFLATEFAGNYTVQAFAGDLAYQIGDKNDAIGYYLKAIALGPANYAVWQNVIQLEMQDGLYDSVIVHSDQALEYFPNQAIFYLFNGVANFIKSEYKRSVQILELGKRYTTDNRLLSQFHGQLGDAYNGLEENEKSDKAYEEALKVDPDNDHVLNNYSYYLSLRNEKMDRAREMGSRLIESHPENPTYLDTYGWVLYVLGEYEESKKYLQRAAELDDEDGTIIEHYGDVLFRLGDIDAAVEQWERASRTDEASDNIQKKIEDRQIYE